MWWECLGDESCSSSVSSSRGKSTVPEMRSAKLDAQSESSGARMLEEQLRQNDATCWRPECLGTRTSQRSIRKELERALLGSKDKICIATIADLAMNDRGRHRFEVNEKLRGKEVSDAERSAEQVRNEEDMSRMAELKTTHVAANEVIEDSQKKNSEFDEAKAILRAESSVRAQERERTLQNSTKGDEEQNQEGRSSRRTLPHKTKSKRWDWRGEERTWNTMITEVTEAIAQVVRYGPAEQTWIE